MSPADLGLQPRHVLVVSGPELEGRFLDAFCTSNDDVLCTGSEVFLTDNSAVYRQYDRRGGTYHEHLCPYTYSEPPVMIQELFAAVAQDSHSPSEPLVLEPVLRMAITTKSCHTNDFLTAKGELYTGGNPSGLSFFHERQHNAKPVSVTWRVFCFTGLEHLSYLLRTKF